MLKLIIYVLVLLGVSLLCVFLNPRIKEFLIQSTQVIIRIILLPIKDWVNNALKYLMRIRHKKIYNGFKITTLPLGIFFIMGLAFCYINYYFLELGMVFIIPPSMDEVVGFNVRALAAILWILSEIIIGVILFEIHFPLNIFPSEFINWVNKNKIIKNLVTIFVLILFISGAILSFYRNYVASNIFTNSEQIISYDTWVNKTVVSDSSITVSKPIILIVISSLVSLIFPFISLLTISLGLSSIITLIKIAGFITSVVVLAIFTGLVVILSNLLTGIAILLMGIISIIAEPARLIVKHVFGINLSNENKLNVQNGNEKNDENNVLNNKRKISNLFIILLVLFPLLTGCLKKQILLNNPRHIVVVVDLSGSFREFLERTRADIEHKILTRLKPGDELTVLSISDNSFDENKSIIYHIKLPESISNDWTKSVIRNIQKSCMESINFAIKKRAYNNTDIWGALFFAAYVLKNETDNHEKYLVIFSDLNDTVKDSNRDLFSLTGVNVIVLYVNHGTSERKFIKKVQYWEKVFRESNIKSCRILDSLLSKTAKII